MRYSKLAILLAAPSADEDDNPDWDAVAWCDSKLQEVRGVLSLTADRRMEKHGHCWCRKDLTDDDEPHNEFCLRARELMSRLQITEADAEVKL